MATTSLAGHHAHIRTEADSGEGRGPYTWIRPAPDGSSGDDGPRDPYVASRSTFCYNNLMPKTIAQRELRNDNARVIQAVAAGETFVITRNGIPVAELRPIRRSRRTAVPKEELTALASCGPRVDLGQFRADLDRLVDQGL